MDRPNIPLRRDLDGKHKGETIVLVGSAPYLKDMDLHPLDGITTIGCNRNLLHPYFRPTYLMASDRRPYIKEMQAGRYKEWADRVKMMFSTSMYDPIVKCHGSPIQTPPTDFPWFPWRARGSSSAMNWTTLSDSLNSFANAAGPMMQAAVIMGAKRIMMMGLGLVPAGSKGRFYAKKPEAWSSGRGSSHNSERCFRRAKPELDKLGIQVDVCSLENAVLESIYGKYPYKKFLKEEALSG